jgi:uncharacterized membrane protein
MTAKKRKQRISEYERELIDYMKVPIHIKVLKIIVILAAIGIIAYVFVNQFVISEEFNYFYDIGSEEDNYLSPEERVSEKIIEEGVNYRFLKEELIYFEVPVAKGSEAIVLITKLKENIPEEHEMYLGARNQKDWNYTFQKMQESSLKETNEDWKISNINFNVKESNLFVEKGKLGFVLSIPHLYDEKYTNYTIPIDWIDITVYKPGLLEKWEVGKYKND